MSQIQKIKWIDLPSTKDERGVLTAIEATRDIPIEIKRIFYMHQIISDRGGHAHRDTDQVLVAMCGSFQVDISDGVSHQHFEFSDPCRGLYVPRMLFTRLSAFSQNSVCLVLANTHYDMSQSIRTWEDYLQTVEEIG